MIFKTRLLEIIWTVWSNNNKEMQLRNLKISAEIGTLTFLAQVRYFIRGGEGWGEKLQYLKIQTRTIQG